MLAGDAFPVHFFRKLLRCLLIIFGSGITSCKLSIIRELLGIKMEIM